MIRFFQQIVPQRFASALLCAANLLLCAAAPSWAADVRIVRTGPGVYQASTLREKIVVSYEVPGVFIALGPPIALPAFTPLDLENADTLHVFVRLNTASNRYVSVIANGIEEYEIRDNFSLRIGSQIRLDIDNSLPYLSVVVEAPKSGGAVLGLAGLDVVANRSGAAAVKLLQANSDPRHAGAIDPYLLRSDGLSLAGKEVGAPLGVNFDRGLNVCLKGGNVFVSEGDLRRITSVKDKKKRLDLLQSIMRRRDSAEFLKRFFPIRVGTGMVIALDTETEKLKSIEPIANLGFSTQVCVVKDALKD